MDKKIKQGLKNGLEHGIKRERLFDGITDIRDGLVGQAAGEKRPFWKSWQFAGAAAVFAVVVAGVLAMQSGKKQTVAARAVAKAEYPDNAPYPDEQAYFDENGNFDDAGFSKEYDAWWEDVKARRELTGYEEGLDSYFTRSIRAFLSGQEGENRVCSPLNIYMALGMMAELTEGNSRQQILDLLGSENIEALRTQASLLWRAGYCDDGALTSILASSLWLNKDITFNQKTLDLLADHYYASSYQGEMGSEDLDGLFQDWLNEQTGGLLKEQVSTQKLGAETVMALAATIYFRAKWSSEFLTENTTEEVFYTPSGDVNCDFMHKNLSSQTYYWGKQFSSIACSLNESGSMWFLLPDKGVSPQELLTDDQAMEFLLLKDKSAGWKDQKQMLVNLSIPKFDVSCQTDMEQGLKSLGITDIFKPETSDFSPLTRAVDGMYLSRADHAARVAVDEKGVTAAAYTVMAVCGTGMPMGDEIDFVLDRPFLFAITGGDGLPLFVGIVNQP